MVPTDASHPRPEEARPPTAEGSDLLSVLSGFLTGPKPRLLVLGGRPGTGKTSLLRALRARLPGPKLQLAYRLGDPSPATPYAPGPLSAGVSIVVTDAEGLDLEETPESLAAIPAAVAVKGPAGRIAVEGLPESIVRGIATMVSRGSGTLLIDEWDRSRQPTVGLDRDAVEVPARLAASGAELTERLAQTPVHTVAVILEPVAPDLKSIAEGVLHLGFLEWDGPPVRVLQVEKLSADVPLAAEQLFTLDEGRFYAPPRLPRGFAPPLPPIEDDPDPEVGTIWPGSSELAGAFGRLRHHGLTGLELARGLPNVFAELVWLPVVAHTLRSGGRVVVIPPVSTTPSRLCEQLGASVPADVLRRRLRVLSPVLDPRATSMPEEVLLPLPTPPEDRERVDDGRPKPVGPQLPEVYRFLTWGEPGRTSLFVISLDGLRAVAVVTGMKLEPTTLPLVISVYAGLPGFHALGLGRVDDPLAPAFIPTLTSRIRMESRDGLILLYGVEPPSPCFMVEWPRGDARYRLVRSA